MPVVENMSKCTVLIFSLHLLCARAKFYKKLTNKKIMSNPEYHTKDNLFQCDNFCKKKAGCAIVNYNKKLQICQLTDRDTNHNYDDAVLSDGWEVYIPIMDKVIICRDYSSKKIHRSLISTCIEFFLKR